MKLRPRTHNDFNVHEKYTKIGCFFKCLLRLGVLRVFVLSVCWFLYVPFCHGALKFDISTLFTTFFLWTFLYIILCRWYNIYLLRVSDCVASNKDDDGLDEPYFLKSPTNISVVEGEMAVLKCSIANLGPKMVNVVGYILSCVLHCSRFV